ncbi:MAG: glycosyltransferase family 2 protein [Paludibacteraceae bacterium]|nr:glycosyltransferase family 2 protein [Paludibacteraceae bacterium]
MKLNIVVPCYNEETVLQETTKQLSALIDSLIEKGKVKSCDIVYVDDGSYDTTWGLIKRLQTENKYVHGLKLAHNVGHQHALWAGLKWSADRCDAVVSIDADLQDDISVMEQMVDAYKEGCDVVFGVRKERKTDTIFKRWTALTFYRLMKKMGVDIVYNHADFRLTSQRATKELMLFPERNIFLRGMVKLLGYKTSEVYYNRKERFAGESKYPLKKMINFALDGITSFSIQPLRLITSFGFLVMVLSVAAAIYALVSYLCGSAVAGWTSMLISIWFIGGTILLSIGIIGEYVGKIYKEVKRRPRYIIEESI